jgi:hypothetical protein
MSHQIDTLQDAALLDDESAPFLKHHHPHPKGDELRRLRENTNKFLFPMSAD